MNIALRIIYRIYQTFIALPLILLASVITSLTTIIGCFLGNGHFWGYYPGKLWSRFICTVLLLPVKIEGREHLKKGQSYVFVANHQGFFDVFLIYGYLNRNFKWMMKQSLRKMPLVGPACAAARHIFVDKRGASKIRATYDKARETLQDGMSLVVFRGSTYLHWTHGTVPTRRLHACRRASATCLSADYQWLFQCDATHPRLPLRHLASAKSHHP